MRRTKPDGCYVGKEWQFQIAAVQLITHKWPTVIPVHVENEGKRTPMAARISRGMGLKAGVPDILIFKRTSHFNGLAIELKVWPNNVTPEQEYFLKHLEDNGWLTAVAYGIKEVDKIVTDYFK